MESFTPVSALIGGLLIGLASVMLMLFLGRIAGISGIVGGLFDHDRAAGGWRLAFVAGLIAGPMGVAVLDDGLTVIAVDASPLTVVAAGFLVGLGTRLGSGCTSGHGVCGLARRSTRSLVATGLFMSVAAVVVFVQRHAVGG